MRKRAFRRLVAALSTDVRLQGRNQLYIISIVVSLLSALLLMRLGDPKRFGQVAAVLLLMFAGGTTLVYVVAMLILERADGTLNALRISPLRTGEYLAAKVFSLTLLATFEGILMTYGAIIGLSFFSDETHIHWPDIWTWLGIAFLGAQHVLIGIILVARYERILEVLVPLSLVAIGLQIPALWFIGAFQSHWFLIVPSAGPTLLIRHAWQPLAPWMWWWAGIEIILSFVCLSFWANSAFHTHITRNPQ